MSPRRARRYWLLKTAPETFSWEDLEASPAGKTLWDGVRNYQARNLMRDEMRPGDLAIFYHSESKPPAAMGIVRVTRTGLPDPSQFDASSPYHDAKADPSAPRWFAVEVALERAFARPVPLPELRAARGLGGMALLARGNRLSVQPVTAREWAVVTRLAATAHRR